MSIKKPPIKGASMLTNGGKPTILSLADTIHGNNYHFSLMYCQDLSVTGLFSVRSPQKMQYRVNSGRIVFRRFGRSHEVPIFQAMNGSNGHKSREFKSFKEALGFLCSEFTNGHIVNMGIYL